MSEFVINFTYALLSSANKLSRASVNQPLKLRCHYLSLLLLLLLLLLLRLRQTPFIKNNFPSRQNTKTLRWHLPLVIPNLTKALSLLASGHHTMRLQTFLCPLCNLACRRWRASCLHSCLDLFWVCSQPRDPLSSWQRSQRVEFILIEFSSHDHGLRYRVSTRGCYRSIRCIRPQSADWLFGFTLKQSWDFLFAIILIVDDMNHCKSCQFLCM